MGAVVLSLPNGFETPDLKDFVAFIGLAPEPSPSRRLSVNSETLFKLVAEVSDEFLLRAVSEHTLAGFDMRRKEVFGDYIKSVMALGKLVEVKIPEASDRASIIEESLAGMASYFKTQAVHRFGPDISDQAVFTVWTVQKIHRLLAKITNSPVLHSEAESDDRKLSREFSVCAWWSLFHLDCLLAAIKHNKSIHPEVLEEIAEGLRSAVDAYCAAKQGLSLRRVAEPVSVEPPEWDEEDQAILDDSMLDLDRAAVNDGF